MNTFVILLSALCIGVVFARSGYVFASWLHFNSRCRPLYLPWFLIPVIVAACMGTIHPVFVCIGLGAFLGILLGGLDPEKSRY